VSPRAKGRLTFVLAASTVLVLALSIPAALRDAFARGGVYLFSQEFLDDIPRRLTGPGRMRFFVQPTVAIALAIAAGRRDSQAGRAPFLLALLTGKVARAELVRSAARDITNLVLLGVLLDALSQWIILGMVHPGVALLVGPVLISTPYVVARALANRATSALHRRRERRGEARGASRTSPNPGAPPERNGSGHA
jgi:hypothetical protein